MTNRLPFSLLFILFFSGLVSYAQTGAILENNAPSVKWYQMNSPHFRILFQEDGDSLATAVANTLEAVYHPGASSLEERPGKIPVILQGKSSVSNGFVALGPRRSEFFVMPPQDYNFLGLNRWMDLLAIHEYRHVVQFKKSKTGWNKIIYYLFGEEAYGAFAHLAIPQWFWEGDAVAVETALTNSGRGRLPRFSLGYRANLLEKGAFSYSKQYLGSFRDFVPDYYVTGFFLTTHVSREFGRESWSRITERAFHAPFLPGRTPYALRKETGKNLGQTYLAMTKDIKNVWEKQIADLKITPAETITRRKNETYTNYSYPQALGGGKVIALKSGLGDIRQFVLLDSTGKEEPLFTPGLINDSGMLSEADNQIVWNEFGFDPRWRKTTYSVIKSYDIASGKARQWSKKSRFSSAALSPDGSRIVTVETTENGISRIAVIGEGTKRFPNDDNAFYLMPRWSESGDAILAVKLLNGKKTIVQIDYQSGLEKRLMDYVQENIGHCVPHGAYIFYNASFSGIDNIYALDTLSGRRYQVTSRKYGAYNPSISPDSRFIYFNDYSVNGMNVARMPLDPTRWIPVEDVEDRNDYYYQPLVEQEHNAAVSGEVDTKDYPVSRYRRMQGLINPFAWGAYIEPTLDNIFFGVVSQDILSSTRISAGYQFDASERTGRWTGQLSYQTLFPIIDASFSRVNRSVVRNIEGHRLKEKWTEDAIDLGLRVPLVLTNSKYHESLNMGANFGIIRLNNLRLVLPDGSETPAIDGSVEELSYRIAYNRLLKQSKRDIRSRWGQAFYLQYKHTPFGKRLGGKQFGMQGTLLLPGLIKHHSLAVSGAYQYEPRSDYPFERTITFPRGYAYAPHRQFFRGSVDYALPLAYPDFHIGPLVNIQRIRANLFYDAGTGITDGLSDYYNSLGVELSADMNFFRLLPLFELGIRYVYVPENDFHSFGLLIGDFSY